MNRANLYVCRVLSMAWLWGQSVTQVQAMGARALTALARSKLCRRSLYLFRNAMQKVVPAIITVRQTKQDNLVAVLAGLVSPVSDARQPVSEASLYRQVWEDTISKYPSLTANTKSTLVYHSWLRQEWNERIFVFLPQCRYAANETDGSWSGGLPYMRQTFRSLAVLKPARSQQTGKPCSHP